MAYLEVITMREIEIDGRILVTTLLDPQYVSARALHALYAMRWNIEVDFRVIKSTLQMDVLCCKSQAMVEKEIAVCLLAYNLVVSDQLTTPLRGARICDGVGRLAARPYSVSNAMFEGSSAVVANEELSHAANL